MLNNLHGLKPNEAVGVKQTGNEALAQTTPLPREFQGEGNRGEATHEEESTCTAPAQLADGFFPSLGT